MGGIDRVIQVARAGVLSLMVVADASALAADPTLDQVYEAARVGRLDQAQQMMTEVLRDHPDSAKAHYVEAEILARQWRYTQAEQELNRAEQLAPDLPFASRASVQELGRLIASAELQMAPAGTASLSPASGSGFPWTVLVIVLVGAMIIYAIVRARPLEAAASYRSGDSGRAGTPSLGATSAGVAPPGAAEGVPSAPTPSPYGAPPVPPGSGGLGSSIVGGLATGAAVGAGAVAGEALARELIGGHGSAGAAPRSDDEDGWN